MNSRHVLGPAMAAILLTLAVLPVSVRIIPEANATHGGNAAIVSLWHEGKKSNVVFDTTLVSSTVIMEVNVTDAVRLKGFDITLRYNINVLDGISVSFGNPRCPTDEGCLFQGNNIWDSSPAQEPVAYDANDNRRFDTGETVIRTPAPSAGTPIENDPKIKYVDANSNNVWNSGEAVVYDTNQNDQYNSGEPVISGTASVGAALKTDPKIRFNDNKVTVTTIANQVDVTPGVIRLAVTISDTAVPFYGGTGTLFRANFTSSATRGATHINIDESASKILDPDPVPYKGIDGFFDDRTAPEFNYSVTPTPTTSTINRPVSGTASSSPISVNVALLTGTTRSVNLQALGLPTGTTASFSANNQNPTFTSTLTLTINGGPAGGATTAPSGSYILVIAGNASVAVGHLVRVGYLTLTIVPPPPPTFTVGSSPTSLTMPAGLSGTSTITTTLTGGTAENVSLSAPLVPAFAQATFSPSLGTPTFSSTMTLTAGSFTSEPLLSFTLAPAQGSSLKTDSGLKIIDSDSDGFYDSSEHVVYDTNNNNIYDSGEPDVTFLGATIGSSLVTDPRVKYFDSNGNNVWDSSPAPGEPVVYDYDSSNTYNQELIAVSPAGTYTFDITATSAGTYSEVSNTEILGFTFTATARDVAVTGITVSRDFAYNGVSANPIVVTVTVANQGSATETFTVSIKTSTTNIVGSQQVTLSAGGTTSVPINFNAHLLARGTYTLSADIFDPHHPSRGRAAPVWDSDPVDNASTYGTITVRFGGDVNGDCVVNVSDLAAVGAAFGSSIGPPASPNWNPNADLNNDGVVNVSDLAAVGSRFGQSC